MYLTPAALGIILSKLQTFSAVDHALEQYVTPSQIAAEFLTLASHDIADKQVLDLGAGTGILSIGAALLGGTVTCIEKDEQAIVVLRQNYDTIAAQYDVAPLTVVHNSLEKCEGMQTDTIIMNPPFGTKNEGIDVQFLKKAFQWAPVIWSMHKTTTIPHIAKVAALHNFAMTAQKDIQFPILKTHAKHSKPKKNIAVTMICLRKNNN